MKSNLESQLELESKMSDLGEKRYRESVSDASNDFNTAHIQKVVSKLIEPFAYVLEQEYNKSVESYRGKGRKSRIHNLFLVESLFKEKFRDGDDVTWKHVPLTFFQVSFISLRCIFGRLRDNGEDAIGGKVKQNNFSIEIGRNISEQLVDSLDKTEEVHYGSMLVRLLISSFPDWFVHTIDENGEIQVPYDWFDSDSKNKEYIVEPSEYFIDFCDEYIDAIAELSMMIMPMIYKPEDWDSNGHNGGFYSDNLKRNIIKGRGMKKPTGVNSKITTVVNAIQSTPWKVNRFIYDYMESVKDIQPPTLKKVFPKEIVADTARPFPKEVIDSGELTDEQKKIVQLWKFRCEKFKKDKQARRSRIMSREAAMKQAKDFIDYEEIYFPHDLDYRNRLYNICMTGLNTQGSDIQKALIQLANARPVTTSEGIRWMKINLANLMGEDKARLSERVKYVDNNESLIRCVVNDPVNNIEWHEWDKPMQGLAAAHEYVKWLDDPTTPLNLHVQLDGLCNGVQNLAAITGDSAVAPHVGLIPTEDRGDVYQYVCDGVIVHIGDESIEANEWIRSGLMTRKLTKTPVMTRSYGSTLYGIKDGVKDFIEENEATEFFNNMISSANWMGDKIWDTMTESLKGPMAFMEWVQQCAGILAKHNLPMRWVNPIGMACVQSPFKDKPKRVKTYLNGKRVVYQIREKIDKIDKSKSESSSSPNVIHSCDASHLIKTVLLCLERGISEFAMVHDSFGCHPDDAAILLECTKSAWIEMYKIDWMQVWYENWCQQLGDNWKELPKPPKRGDLDISAVKDSDFFFA